MTHIYALSRHAHGRTARLLYSSNPRCALHPNPKRPTWRCKAKPVWLVRSDVDRNLAAPFCDRHKKEVLGQTW